MNLLFQVADMREMVTLIVAFLGILGTFATVIAMFASLKKTVENLSDDFKEHKTELKDAHRKLEVVARLEERMNNYERQGALKNR